MHFRVCFLILILSFIPVGAAADTKTDLVQQLKRRYDNFFERLKNEESRERLRLSGTKEIEAHRQMDRELKERARKKFISERKPHPDTTRAYQLQLEQEARDRKAYLERQKAYSKMMAEIEHLKNTAKKIPDVLEYQLQDAL